MFPIAFNHMWGFFDRCSNFLVTLNDVKSSWFSVVALEKSDDLSFIGSTMRVSSLSALAGTLSFSKVWMVNREKARTEDGRSRQRSKHSNYCDILSYGYP